MCSIKDNIGLKVPRLLSEGVFGNILLYDICLTEKL